MAKKGKTRPHNSTQQLFSDLGQNSGFYNKIQDFENNFGDFQYISKDTRVKGTKLEELQVDYQKNWEKDQNTLQFNVYKTLYNLH